MVAKKCVESTRGGLPCFAPLLPLDCVCVHAHICVLCAFEFGVNVCRVFEAISALLSICLSARFVIVCSPIISRLHYSNYCRGTITTLTNAHPSGLSCVCVCVCVWRRLHLLALPILWQLSLIMLRMDPDLPLTSSGLETADN